MQHHYLVATFATATILITPILTLLYLTWRRTATVPSNLPWIGAKNKRIFAQTRACLAEITAGRSPIDEGYNLYSKQGKAFVLPGFIWPVVVLPPQEIPWLASQPENIFSSAAVQDGILALRYLGHGPDLNAMVDFTVLRRDLTRQLSRILPDVLDEMTLCFEEELPSGIEGEDEEEWHQVKLFRIIEAASRRFNNRVFIGSPLCRDPRYISGLRWWEVTLGICSAVIRHLIPEVLQPFLAPIVALPCQIQIWRLRRFIMPLIRRRVAMRSEISDIKKGDDGPNDVLQWLIDAKLEGKDHTGMSFDDIAGKAILLNFFSVHTISINTSLTLTNILSHTTNTSLTSQLRHEAEEILPQLPHNPRLVREMSKLDSVIRESLRVSTMTGREVNREVVHPAGVTTPSGLYLPRGTHVCAVLSSRQRDGDVWEGGDAFAPMRFYQNGEEENPQAKHAVHVTEDFLSFGLGRHACPGRFFAVQAMKIMLAHLLVNYDFEPLKERPKFVEIGDAMVPSDKSVFKMRRRRRPRQDV